MKSTAQRRLKVLFDQFVVSDEQVDMGSCLTALTRERQLAGSWLHAGHQIS